MPVYRADDATTLHYDELAGAAAAGPPIVVLAGGAARHPVYLGDLAGLAERHPLVIPHLRGVGASPAPDEPEAGSYWRQADDVEALRRHLGHDRLLVAGHSAGTRLAVAYAVQHPERVAALLLVTPPSTHLVEVAPDTAAIAARRTDDAFTQAWAALQAAPSELDDDGFGDWQRRVAPAGYAHWGPAEREHATQGGWDLAAGRAYFSVDPPADLAARLASVTAPVLVVAGADDALTGFAPVAALAERFPSGRVAVVEDCGHYPWVERPAEFRAAVDAFLDDVVEVPLVGGDVSDGVVRVGGTVRRHPGRAAAAVHAYLRHLEAAGFPYAPRFLGFDDRGREILTFLDGEMGGRPLAPWAVTEDALREIAVIQRRLHDAAAGFTPPDGVGWPVGVELPGVPSLFDAPDVVGHNDITFENTIFVDGRPAGIIDFDLAGPTTRLLDVITTLRHWAPMAAPADRDPALRDADAGRRMRIFVDAYGLDDDRRAALLDVADRRYTRVWHVMKYRAETDGGGWARMWEGGAGDAIKRAHDWFRAERDTLAAALTG
ncbi:alpha/beta fold hydrolase [Jiangella sp. DSM 45060]|uniref:alpha/beta fold hydrolase n=1 Tax=Jiangella sp. DSM 45060 TaxID=1798224 RepID=UPI00087AC936|nr:alpha/beta fold hydrolase [Jiangella sp. DSM 45060]SDS30616.1 Pimeloyl-ACP methyl ester carboxylesterase [Jiangella sp. DSM 45060]